MENKKFDLNSVLGFVFMGLILMWMFYSQSKQTKIDQAKKAKEQKIADSIQKVNQKTKVIDSQSFKDTTKVSNAVVDSLKTAQLTSQFGSFAYSGTLPSATENKTVLENEVLKITVNNKGGQIDEILLKKYLTYDKKPLYLVKDKNSNFVLNFNTKDNRVLNTKDLFFEPKLLQDKGVQSLSMRLKVSEDKYLEYIYTLKSNDYMMDFNINSIGLEGVLDSSKPVNLQWDLKSFRTEKSVSYENMNTVLSYHFDKNEFDLIRATGKVKTENVEETQWIAYRQQFFSSILIAKNPIKSAKLIAENLVKDDTKDTIYLKKFSTEMPLAISKGNLNNEMNFYFGPSDYNVLKSYKGLNLERSIDMGWGLFRWINKYMIIPVFDWLTKYIGSLGLVIILLTIVVKIVLSPLVFKSYIASAKMKVLRPEMEEINKKYPGKDNAMKRQQEIMAIQSKAGVSMLSGCIPALLQMPIFFALFRFFPSNFDLRQKGFLWADDLSAYDSIYHLPFHIPVYGSHVALFPILASVAIFFYMQMTQSQQANMQAPQSEDMPFDMQKMMKVMLWVSPVMMLFFFNQYGSGLSLYYFISNLLTIAIMWVIKEYVVDEQKVHDLVRKKQAEAPKKKSAFRQRLDDAMKQAQEQQERQKNVKGKK